MSLVLDSSALLAYLYAERGREQVVAALEAGAVMHAVNWAETLSKLAERGIDPEQTRQALIQADVLYKALQLDLGLEEDTVRAARLRPLTRAAGLSLGDRFCLALGQRLKATVLTADQPWTSLSVGVTIECIRSQVLLTPA